MELYHEGLVINSAWMHELIQNLCPKLGSGLLSAVNVMSQRRRHPSQLKRPLHRAATFLLPLSVLKMCGTLNGRTILFLCN